MYKFEMYLGQDHKEPFWFYIGHIIRNAKMNGYLLCIQDVYRRTRNRHRSYIESWNPGDPVEEEIHHSTRVIGYISCSPSNLQRLIDTYLQIHTKCDIWINPEPMKETVGFLSTVYWKSFYSKINMNVLYTQQCLDFIDLLNEQAEYD